MPVKKKKFQYRPLSLKEILKEMKQNIDFMIDLSYSAIKFGSKDIADEAGKIEKRIHELTFLLNLQIIQTQTGGVKEAKKLPEPIVKVSVGSNCEFIGKYRKQIHFRSNYGVDLIAIKRDDKWLFNKEQLIQENDILIIKGELEPLKQLKTLACDVEGFSFQIENHPRKPDFSLESPDVLEFLQDLKRDYILITDISETMIELALAALFFNSYEVAEDVLEMEELMDGLNIAFEKDLLEFAHLVENPRDLTGIMRIIFSCEQIADCAANIAENVLKGF
ncbi:MAG: PhoU domain-containing protein, partial [Candidatus Lokiarchaeota archaeon]